MQSKRKHLYIILKIIYAYVLCMEICLQDAARGEQVLKALAEDCLRPSKVNTWPVLIDWFKSPASYQNSEAGESGTMVDDATVELTDPWRIVRKGEPMGVDEITGTWGRTRQINTLPDSGLIESVTKQHSLLSIDLTYEQKQRMMNTIGKIAVENNKNSTEEATKKWSAYTRWLSSVGKNSFDVIIDGANGNIIACPPHIYILFIFKSSINI
jgi:hypothetical protein